MPVLKTLLQTVRAKVEDEGLGYCVENYFGRDLNSHDKQLNNVWEAAYDALQDVYNKLYKGKKQWLT